MKQDNEIPECDEPNMDVIHNGGMETLPEESEHEYSGDTLIVTLPNGIRKTFEYGNVVA